MFVSPRICRYLKWRNPETYSWLFLYRWGGLHLGIRKVWWWLGKNIFHKHRLLKVCVGFSTTCCDFLGEWCFIRWGRSSKKIDIHVLPFLVCLAFSPKEGLRSSQVNIMLARIYSVPAEWWDFKLLWGWESVLCTWKFTLPEDGWLEYKRFLLGQWEGLSSGAILAVSFRAPCQFYTIFSQGEPSRSPTSSTTMPPWPHVTCCGKKWGLMKFLAGGLKYGLFSPLFWGRFPIWREYFSDGLKPPSRVWFQDFFLNRPLVLGVRVFFHFLCEGTLVPFLLVEKVWGVVKIWGGDFVAYTLED